MSPSPTVLAVENSRNAGCGRITRFWSSSVSLPSTSSTRWITNITSGPAGVVFVEAQRHRVLQRPGQDAFAELGDLLAVAQHDRVLADEIDAADVAVEIDPDAGPVEARRDLLDMGRFAGAVIAADHHAAVEGEAGEDRQRRVAVEAVGVVDVGNVLARLAEGRNLEIAVDAEGLTDRDLDVRRADRSRSGVPLAERMALLLVLSGVAGKGWPRILSGSVEIAGLQGRIGLVDDLQLLLGGLVAAMGVGVVLLDQHLVARLEAHRGQRRFEIEHRQRLLARR